MLKARSLALTSFAMLAFAGNSLFCRLALEQTDIDAASFTSIRLGTGALVLWCAVQLRRGAAAGSGTWLAAGVLVAYAVCFSFAYEKLTAATGALLLFGAGQATMIGHGIRAGERLRVRQLAGLVLAVAGLLVLLLPGLAAPPLSGAMLMLGAGFFWGVYSLHGQKEGDPVRRNAGNFSRALPFAAIVSVLSWQGAAVDSAGIAYAMLSGGLTTGLGYVIWYAVLPHIKATTAATVQLSVPVLAALGGGIFLGEQLSLRFVLAATATLGGIALVVVDRRRRAKVA